MSVGLNSLMEFARRALHANQTGLNIVGHNIANANRTDYSRQRVSMVPNYPIMLPEGAIGTGVDVEGVSRIRDVFIDGRVRREYGSLGQWEYREKVLTQIEQVLNEPSDTGLSSLLNNFWDGWQELINNPENYSARASVRQRATMLTSRMNQLDESLKAIRSSLNHDIQSKVESINNMTKEIAAINNQIITLGDKNNLPNDLLDLRDKYIDDLSRIVDVDYREQSNGSVSVILNGHNLVDFSNNTLLTTETRVVDGQRMEFIILAKTKEDIVINEGELKGIFDLRDQTIPDLKDQLDTLAVSLVNKINEVHSTGYDLEGKTNNVFFEATTTGAGDIRVADAIMTDVNKIAAAGTDAPGDNSVAQAIYDLREQSVMANDTQTIEEYYNSLVSEFGLITQEATFHKDAQELVVNQIENQRQMTMGVSLDEEMVSLIKLQTAYQAASKVITTANELMATLLNMVQ